MVSLEFFNSGSEVAHQALGWTIFLASLPTMITLIGTAAVAIWQLRHDRRERAKDRALGVKKEVLLQAVRGISEAQSCLTKYSNLDIPARETQEISGNAGKAISAALAIGDLAVVEAIRDYQRKSGEGFFELVVLRRKADAIKKQIDTLRKRADHQLKADEVISEKYLQALLASDDTAVQRANEIFQSRRESLKELSSQIKDLESSLVPIWREMLMMSTRKRIALAENSRRVIGCIRRDMQVDCSATEMDEFLRITHLSDEARDQMIKAVEDNMPESAKPSTANSASEPAPTPESHPKPAA